MSKFSDKPTKTYCKIMHYVEEKNPTLADILRTTCHDMTLSSFRGKGGITLLMPDDALVKEIKKLVDSTDPDEADKGANMIAALILRDVYKTGSDFTRGEVANCLWKPQVVKVKSASGNKVEFENGASAEKASDFIEMAGDKKRKKIEVWRYKGAHFGLNGKEATLPDPRERGSFKKTGSYEPTQAQLNGTRFKLMLAVEQEYVHRIISSNFFTNGGMNAYCEASIGLLAYLKKTNETLYFELLGLVAFDNLDFYFLVQPHVQGDYLIDDDTLSAWVASRRSAATNTMKDLSMIRSDLKSHKEGHGKVLSDRNAVLDKIDSLRSTAISAVGDNFRGCFARIEEMYSKLETDNSIGGLVDVFSNTLHEFFKGRSGTKMLYDDVRYIAYQRFHHLEHSGYRFDFGEFNALVNFIGDALSCADKTARLKNLHIFNKERIKYLIAPTMERDEALCFVNSTMFLCVPVLSGDKLGRNVSIKPRPGKIGSLFNIHAAIEERYDHMAAATYTNMTNEVALLNDAQRKELLKQLQQYENR